VHGGGLPVVTPDHSTTGELAAQHLVGLGHREIATVTGPRARRVVRSRHQAFLKCLREAGAQLPARCVAEADWTPAGAYAAAQRLLDAGPSVGAIFVHSDVMTLGVLRALRDRGIRVPDDCSVVSCDDVYLAPFTSPPLTTIHVPSSRRANGRSACYCSACGARPSRSASSSRLTGGAQLHRTTCPGAAAQQ
jgi:LacI family transcriptional regulator